LAALQA
ncbi:hypothetical protein MKD33_08515, partial [Chromobacterium piscinae]